MNLFQCWQLNHLWAYHEESNREKKDKQQIYQKWENRFYKQIYQQSTEDTYITDFNENKDQKDQVIKEFDKRLIKLNINHYTFFIICWNCDINFQLNNKLYNHICRDCFTIINQKSVESSLNNLTVVSFSSCKQSTQKYVFWE